MKPIINKFVVFAFAAGSVAVAGAQDLQGPWTLRIDNMEHREISSLTIRFTDKAAPSCMAGNWKRVIVERSKTTNKEFFPMSEPLSYQIVGSELTIGRNEVCDGYLHLRGKLDASGARGTYSGFGISGGDQLGHFLLKRDN